MIITSPVTKETGWNLAGLYSPQCAALELCSVSSVQKVVDVQNSLLIGKFAFQIL